MYPLVLEIRHRSWDRVEVYEFLQELGLGSCNIDQPQASYLIGLTRVVTSPVGYLRRHGLRRENRRRGMTTGMRQRSCKRWSRRRRS
jgi:uncharacterized protein YecE (DUF72 family)